MESLYRKYRPLTFDQVVGQAHVVETLEHAIKEGRTSHAYLFTGPRGTGKTTMARILAKAMVCEAGAGNLPDGTCIQCQEIAEGNHPDVYELDAASRTGVDAVREEIVNRVDYAPVQGRSKVYIIDEVHMLTTQAFNALLKTLEEPPAHVVFVLCTTDPQKIPSTILSRVQRFDFRPIFHSDIEKHLLYISEQEGFKADPDAISLITHHVQGGMRDALSLLEQLSVYGKGNLSLENARVLLGEVTSDYLAAISRALAAYDAPTLFKELARILDEGQDIYQLSVALVVHLRDVYVVLIGGATPGVLDVSDDEFKALQKEAAAFKTARHVESLLDLFSDAMGKMRYSLQPRLDLEVAFARAAMPSLVWDESALQAIEKRLLALEEAAGSTPMTPQATEVRAQSMAPKPATGPTSVPAPKPAPKPAPASTSAPAFASTSVPTPAVKSAPAQASVSTLAPASAPAPAPQVSAQQAWPRVIAKTQNALPSLHSLLIGSCVHAESDKEVTIAIQNYSPFAESKLNSPEEKQFLESAFKAAGNSKHLVFVAGSSVPKPTPEPLVQKAPSAAQEPLVEEKLDDSPSESPNESSPDPIPQEPSRPIATNNPGETGTFAPSEVEAAIYNQHKQAEQKAEQMAAQKTEQVAAHNTKQNAKQNANQKTEQKPEQKEESVIPATPSLTSKEQDVVNMITDSFGSAPKVISVNGNNASDKI